MGVPQISSATKDPQQLLRMLGAVPSKIGDLILDVVVRESIDWNWTVTKYKVEAGYNASDLRIKDPMRLVLDVVFVDKQYGVTDIIANTLSREGLAPATWRDKYKLLKETCDIEDPQTVTIGLDSFESMNISHVGIIRDRKKAGYLSCTITLEHTRIIETEFKEIDTSLMPSVDESADDKMNKAKKSPAKDTKTTPKEAKPQQKQSMLSSMFS